MEINCHSHSVDRYIKVKNGLVKVSAIPFQLHDDRFYRYVEVNFTFGLLFHTLYCNIGRAEKCLPLYRDHRFIED